MIIDGNEYEVKNGSAIVVPAGAKHNVINTSDLKDLKFYTIYSPAHRKGGIARAAKEKAVLFFGVKAWNCLPNRFN